MPKLYASNIGVQATLECKWAGGCRWVGAKALRRWVGAKAVRRWVGAKALRKWVGAKASAKPSAKPIIYANIDNLKIKIFGKIFFRA